MRLTGRLWRAVRPEGRAWFFGSWALLFVTVVLGPHAIGGVHPWAIVTLAALAWLALGCSLLAIPERQRRLPTWTWLVLGLWLWTGLQAWFLPCGWIEMLAPEMAEQARDAWSLVSDKPLTTCALSADPGNGREEFIKWGGILCAYLAARLWARAGYGRRLVTLVALSALGLALAALGHFAIEAQRVYGWYTPEHVGSAYLGPLLNVNCLGGFLVLGAGIQVGLAGRSAERRARVFFVVAALICSCVALLTLSRGAIGAACLLAALLALRVLFMRGSHRHGSQRAARAAVPAVGLLGGAALAMWLAGEPISSAISDHDISKLLLWEHAWSIVREHPFLGVGRGAFSAVFTAVYGKSARFVYVENFPLQWAVEWGVPTALALSAWLAVRIGGPLIFARSGFRYCTAAALLVYAVQNLFDIGLELMAPTLAAVVSLAALERRAERGEKPGRFHPGVLLLGLAPAFFIVAPGVLDEDVRTLTSVMTTSAQQKPSPAASTRYEHALRRGLRLHPHEATLPYVAAGYGLRSRDPRAPRFINRALTLAPDWVGPHLLAAQFLWSKGLRLQAADALRRAMAIQPGAVEGVACGMARQAPELLTRTIPQGPNVRRAIGVVSECLPSEHPVRAELDQRLMRHFSDEIEAYRREAHRLRQQGRSDEAQAFLLRELKRHPRKGELWAELARLSLEQGDAEQALLFLQRGDAAAGSTEALVSTRLQVLAQLGRAEEARKTWARLMAMSAKDANSLARLYTLLGSVERRLGNPGQALTAYLQAHRLGGQVESLVQAADLAQEVGERQQARRLWQRICTLEPQRANACAKAAASAGTSGAHLAP